MLRENKKIVRIGGNNMEEQEKQVIEVEYDKKIVEDYKRNYIMEEEGIGADPDAEPYDTQTKFNTDSKEELFDPEDSVVEEVE